MKKKIMALVLVLCILLICTSCTSKAAASVIADIDSIGDVSLESKDLIFRIKSAYEELSEDEKEAVKNYGVLEDAITTYSSIAKEEAQKLFRNGDYEGSKALFGEIGEADSYNSLAYEKGHDLFNEGDFEGAKALFADLQGYNDADEWVVKCEYELTNDRSFMRALARGLVNRWDYSDKGYLDEYGKKTEEMNNQEYISFLKKCIQLELDEIQDYENEDFNDSKLKENAENYIDILKKTYDIADYYTMDYEKYYTNWESLYSERSIAIRDFVVNYDLSVDDEHQGTLDGFITNAKVADEQKQVKDQVQAMIDSVTLDIDKREYSGFVYTAVIENTTDVTFEYFDVEAELYDEENTVFDTVYLGSIDDFAPGKKVKLTGYADEKCERYELHGSYDIKK